jgi:ADP-ribose pyrophosphatase YjhB (NUDIX family)
MREMKVGATIIYHPEYYVMHMRKKGNDIGEIDRFGLYGGTFDPKLDENLQDTARRELEEEAGVSFRVEDFTAEDPDQAIFVMSERDGEDILTEAEIFFLKLPLDITHDRFKDSKPMTSRELRRAKTLGQLTSVAAEALSKYRGI